MCKFQCLKVKSVRRSWVWLDYLEVICGSRKNRNKEYETMNIGQPGKIFGFSSYYLRLLGLHSPLSLEQIVWRTRGSVICFPSTCASAPIPHCLKVVAGGVNCPTLQRKALRKKSRKIRVMKGIWDLIYFCTQNSPSELLVSETSREEGDGVGNKKWLFHSIPFH